MFKQIRGLLFLVALALLLPSLAGATATPVQQGGICVNCVTSGGGVATAVTTSAVVTSLISARSARKSVTLYCTSAVNIEPGDSFGNAPTIAPITGAAGTGIGFFIPATTMVTISAIDSPALLQGSININLPPGDRIDAIAATANGYCYTWEQF